MYEKTLGLSGLRVSAVGLGCMGMSHAYGAPADELEMTELLADAVEMGYTLFDPPRYIARRIVYTIMRNCWERHCARYRNENVSLADLRAANSQHR